MDIRGVAFDLEGTVVNVEPAHHLGHILCAAECGVDLLEIGLKSMVGEDRLEDADYLTKLHNILLVKLGALMQKLPSFVGGGNPSNASLISKFSGGRFSETEVKKLDKHYYKLLLPRIPIVCRPGSLEAIRWFQSRGFPVTIGSLTETTEALFLLTESELIYQFDRKRIVLAEHVKNLKPAPDVFLKTAEIMGIDPQSQLVFEDSANGARAGRAAGSTVIGMPVFNMSKVVLSLMDAGVARVFMDWREMNLSALIGNLSE